VRAMDTLWLDLQVLQQGVDEQKKVELLQGAQVGDILNTVAQLKQVPVNSLFLCERRYLDKAHCLCKVGPSEAGTIVGGAHEALPYTPAGEPVQVKLHRNEVPEGDVFLGGIDNLDGLPDIITVEPKFSRTELTHDECLQLQDELIAAYSEDGFQMSLEKLQAKFSTGRVPITKYARMLSEIILPAQRKVLPRWGFEASPRGVSQMFQAFGPWDNEEDVALKVTIINGMLGTDLAWYDQSNTN